MKSLKEAAVAGKKILLRADLDVPLKDGQVVDDFRIQTALPTIEHLVSHQAKTVIIAHLGRPEGKVVERLRLDPVARWLVETGHAPSLRKINDCVGPEVRGAVEAMADGDILLLENLRFNLGETGNVPVFARQLADLADLYVNDCFATSHREHASIVGVPRLLPAYAGLRLIEETMILHRIIVEAQRPLCVIVGGAKAETKAPLVKKLAKIADKILLGGTLMFETSLAGIPKVVFPIDAVRVDDVGPKTIRMYEREIKKARTVVWNGPLGVALKREFEVGTRRIAEALAVSSAFTVVGGGDTVAALNRFGLRDRMNFVSTGGGAMLRFLADGTLPGIEALEKAA